MNVELIHENAKLPKKALHGDAGYDLFSPERYMIMPYSQREIFIGIKVEFDENLVMLIKDKSGRSKKDKLHVVAGVVDSNYRGEIIVLLQSFNDKIVIIEKNEKVAQFLMIPIVNEEINLVKKINNNTNRKDGKYGSTGLK